MVPAIVCLIYPLSLSLPSLSSLSSSPSKIPRPWIPRHQEPPLSSSLLHYFYHVLLRSIPNRSIDADSSSRYEIHRSFRRRKPYTLTSPARGSTSPRCDMVTAPKGVLSP
ncbi:callose synthase 3-like [Iris pallida]|uniref:Callose synthase 3-like n=1 Tax=Iris pallida TaxID=29817 RepID=A0AAX6GRJ9_IRIPA|nr:callose synthase 3-like [Iris pallida]